MLMFDFSTLVFDVLTIALTIVPSSLSVFAEAYISIYDTSYEVVLS